MKMMVFQGYLKEMYPDGICVDAKSAREAISFLEFHPGFEVDTGIRHRVYLPKFPTNDSLEQPTDEEVIEIIPMPEAFEGGGGKGGILQVIIGAVIVVVGIYLRNPQIVQFGALMMLGGILQMLMPAPPKNGATSDADKSSYLPANRNTVKIGTPIALGFGKRKIYPHLLSFNVTATNLNAPSLTDDVPGEGTTGQGVGTLPTLPPQYGNTWNGYDPI